MENIVRSASSPPPTNESMINSEEIPELPPFDSISPPSDNSSQMEGAFEPIGSPVYMSPEFLESKPLSPRLYEEFVTAACNLRFVKKIRRTPVRRAPVDHPDMMSIMETINNVLNLLTGGAPRKKLMPAEEEVEIRKSIVGAYQTIMKGKTLSVSQLDDIWSRINMLEEDMLEGSQPDDIWSMINMLEEDMQESQDKLLPSCSKYRETIGSLKTELRSLLSFVAPNLRGTCQLHALMREVDRGSDLERAQISMSSIFETKNPTDEFLIGDAAIHSLHGNTAKTSISSFGIGNTTQTGKKKAESYNDPLLPQKNNQVRELEDSSNFAFLGLIMCYAVLYFLYSAFLGKKGSNTRVMTGLHIWTALLMLLLFIGSFIRFSVGTLKVMRLVMSGLLLVSSSLAFILLQLNL